VEDDGRQEDVEEEFRIEDRLRVYLALRGVHHLAYRETM
jgi:hypothetical protein